ncbi:MAG: sigma-70 family RNA polymerase sigma factor [Archangiaceae bacterium]|nr:sigma-70 family RNA polymerase sigma factor [Archangiaceae bacterium]
MSVAIARPSADQVLHHHGPEVLGFLSVLLRDPVAARDVYALFCEDVWRGLPGFRGDCSPRTWVYVVARHAAQRWQRAQPRHALVPLSQAGDLVSPQTRSLHGTTVRDRLERIRAELHPDDQALLTLRIDRQLDWADVARVLLDETDGSDAAAVSRKAAALRKRFERLKAELRTLMLEGER